MARYNTWRKSTRSQANGNCIEIASTLEAIAIRDSKLPATGDYPHLEIPHANWAGLLSELSQ